METNKNAFLVGMFVILVILAGLGFTLWLTAAGKGESVLYRIYFAESVGGLNTGSPVKFRGVNVGSVKAMSVDPTDTNRVRVDMQVLKTAPVKEDTVGTLTLQGLTGDIYVDLSGGSIDKPNLADSAENTLPELQSKPSSINAIMTRLPEIMEKMDRLLERVNHIAGQADKLFSDQNVKEVGGVIHTMYDHYGKKEDKKEMPSESPSEAPARRR